MAKIQIIDSVLPFTCSNPDCEKEYDLELFTEVLLLWGYIYLISEDDGFAIVGLTCPSCLQTTIRKCSSDEALLFNSKLKRQSMSELNQYVLFSYSLLKQWNLIDIEYTRDEEDHPLFFLPPETTQLHNTVDQQFGATEDALSFLSTIENEHRLRSIPRIVSSRSKYMVFDMIFKDETPFDLNETLVSLIKPNAENHIDNVSAKFSHMVSNNLTEEKYNNLDLDLFSHERKNFQQNVQDFLNDAKLVRNKIDFEIVYMDELINVYAEKMYYDPGVVNAKRFELMESIEAMEEEGLVSEDVTLSSSPPAVDMESLPNHSEHTFEKAKNLVFKTTQQPTDEVKIKKPRKLRPDQRHKLAVREVAKKLWQENPNKRIADMIFEDQITNVYAHERDELYTEKTLIKWISDLCPNPKRGRPKKDENKS